MSESNSCDAQSIELAGIRFGILSPYLRRRIWGGSCSDIDASALWPGYYVLVAEWLNGRESFVIGAWIDGTDRIIARAKYSRSRTSRATWYSGYVYSDPDYRRMGVFTHIVSLGFKKMRSLAGRSCVAYVDRANIAMNAFLEKDNWRKLPFVRATVNNPGLRGMDVFDIEVLNEASLMELESGVDLLNSTVGKDSVKLIGEEFQKESPIFPWKKAQEQLFRIVRHHQVLGFGLRHGSHLALILFERFILEAGGTLCKDIISALLMKWDLQKALVFMSEKTWNASCFKGSSGEIHSIYVADIMRDSATTHSSGRLQPLLVQIR